MILDELVLHNFGVYRGRQVLDLSPPTPTRPVILIGGLNGAGKTTLLDAVQLALFGNRAPSAGRRVGGYEQYLRAIIHKGVSQTEGAAVELAFRHQHDGIERHIRVRRRWHPTTKSVRERLQVDNNGTPDTFLSAHWNEAVDQFVPVGIARLVFFDGEKIAALADPNTCADALRAGVYGLLGLDILDRLRSDLSVYERRQRLKLVTDADRTVIQASEARVHHLAQERDRLVIERGERQNALDSAHKSFSDAEARFQLHGGELYENRAQLESRREVLSQRLQDVRTELFERAATYGPLFLVSDLVGDAAGRAALELRRRDAARIGVLLAARDESILDGLRDASIDDHTVARVRDVLAQDRQSRAPDSDGGTFSLPASVCHELGRLAATALPHSREHLLAALSRADAIHAELDLVERDLTRLPESHDVATLLSDRSKAATALEAAARAMQSTEDSLRQATRSHDDEQRRYRRLLVRATTEELDLEDINRTIEYSCNVRRTLDEFRRTLLARNSKRIAALVLDGLQHLLRKHRLVSDLEIEPSSFGLTLRRPNGDSLPAESLSAGERQLLAVSLLWGLARAAGRPLPAIIDTPLGRLDSKHRIHVVERYFPTASHQVVLLSTDEEITATYWQKLRPHIGRTYTLVHDDNAACTRVEEGYFGD